MNALAIRLPQWKKSRPGFTLIELLVVVSIIALLIAILLPSLGKARDTARTAVCLSSLKGLGLSSAIYNNEYNDYMVPGYYWDPASGASGENWATIFTYLKYVPQTIPVPNPATPPTSGTPPYNTKTVLYCPMCLNNATGSTAVANFQDVNGLLPNFQKSVTFKTPAVTWFGINSVTFDPAHISPGRRIANDDDKTNDFWLPKVTKMTSPGMTAYLYDGMWSNLDANLYRIFPRHRGNSATNVMFCDGHGETVARKDLPGATDALAASETGDMHSETDNATNQAHATYLNQHYPKVKWRLDQ